MVFPLIKFRFRNLYMAQRIPDINLFTQPKIRHPEVYRSTSNSKFRDTSFDSYAYSSSNSNFNRPRSYKWDKINSTSDYYLEAMKILSKSKQLSNSSSLLDLFGNWKSRDPIKQNTRVFFPQNLHEKSALTKVLFTSHKNKENQQVNKLNQSPANTTKTKIKSFPQPHKIMVNEVASRFIQQLPNQVNSKGAPNLLLQQKSLQRVSSTPLLIQNAMIKPNICVPLAPHNPNIQINYVQKPKNISPTQIVQNIQLLNNKMINNNPIQVPVRLNQNDNVIGLNQNQLINCMDSQNTHKMKQSQKEQKQFNENSPIAKVANQNFERQTQNQNQQYNFNSSLNSTMIKIANQINKMDSTFSSFSFSEGSKTANQVQAHILLDELAQMKNENIQIGSRYIKKIDQIINRYNSNHGRTKRLTKESFGKTKQKIELTANSSKSIESINN